MDGRYDELIEETSQKLAEGLLADVEYVVDVGRDLDGFVLDKPLAQRSGVAEMIVELDGCEIRTGVLSSEVSEDGKRRRDEGWREVRTGLARVVGEVDPLYVCEMAGYPEVCDDLFGVACLRGLSERTQVIGVRDGGIGLCEEMEVHFPNFRYILDRPHLKSHFFETAVEKRQEACGVNALLRTRITPTSQHRDSTGSREVQISCCGWGFR